MMMSSIEYRFAEQVLVDERAESYVFAQPWFRDKWITKQYINKLEDKIYKFRRKYENDDRDDQSLVGNRSIQKILLLFFLTNFLLRKTRRGWNFWVYWSIYLIISGCIARKYDASMVFSYKTLYCLKNWALEPRKNRQYTLA